MLQPSRIELAALVRLTRELHASRSVDDLVGSLLAGGRSVVPCEPLVWNEYDLSAARVAYIVHPWESEPPGGVNVLIRHLNEHPVVVHHARTGDRRALKFSDFLTRSQLHRTGLYCEFLRRAHPRVEDMFVIHPRGLTRDSTLALSVCRSHRSFTESDRVLLDLLSDHVGQAYRNLAALDATRHALRRAKDALRALNREVVVLGSSDRLGSSSQRGREWLAECFGPWRGSAPPPLLRAWVRDQRSRLAPRDDGFEPPRPLVVQREGRRLSIRLLARSPETILVLAEEREGIDPGVLRALGVSPREAEVLCWVCQGKTNVEIATIMTISPRTVEKHLERIFAKLGVETRTGAATRALELLG